MGEADYTKTILEELGEIAFWNWRLNRVNRSRSVNLLIVGSRPAGQPGFSDADLLSTGTALLAKLSGNTASGLPARQRVRRHRL